MPRPAALALVFCALAGGLAAEEPRAPADPLDLRRAYAKGATGALQVRLAVEDDLLRDVPGKSEWRECRKQRLDLTLRIAWSVKKAPGKSVVLAAVLEDLRGAWSDAWREDGKPPRETSAEFASPSEGAKPAKGDSPWKTAVEALARTPFEIELGAHGGVVRVSGMGVAASKHFQRLSADPAAKALARDLSDWFSDEAWRGLLGLLFLQATPPKPGKAEAAWKAPWRYPLPWTLDLGGRPLPALSLAFKAVRSGEEAAVEADFQEGAVDWQKPIPDVSPGYHALGSEQKGALRAVYGPAGLKEASARFELRDGWDFRGSWADHFDHAATVTLSAAPAGP